MAHGGGGGGDVAGHHRCPVFHAINPVGVRPGSIDRFQPDGSGQSLRLVCRIQLGGVCFPVCLSLLWEPNFDLPDQLTYWEFGYCLVVLLFLAAQFKIPSRTHNAPLGTAMGSVPGARLARWLLLSAAPSALFLAVTNELTFNLAPVPLLWIFPLSIYLLTLVLCFKRTPWCPRVFREHFSLLISLGVLLFLFNMMGHSLLEYLVLIIVSMGLPWYLTAILVEPALWLGGCFVFCLVCHFRLQEDRPEDAGQLTTFYLVLSAGGFWEACW